MLNIEKTSLVLVDVQGKLAELMYDKESVFANCVILVKAAKILDIPILWCQQYPKALGETIPQLAELLGDENPIDKLCFSCAGHPNFIARLNELKREQVMLCGIETHVCVHQTAMDLLDRDYDVHLISDAVSSRTESNKKVGIQRMRDQGVCISSTEMALFELLRTAEHESFKEIAKLIK
jgi:nicotinamidase-related amidase